jgi:3-hydroxyisobutyrate dehydrogenase
MAARLIDHGWSLNLYDTNPAAITAFTDHHPSARTCTTPAEAAKDAAVLITMVPDGQAVRDVVFGTGGAAATFARGGLIIDMTSSSPIDSVRLGKDLTELGFALLDAPVSGGVRSARVGTLTLMIGGDSCELARARELLSAMATTLHHVGALGSGHAMKALNNYVSAAALIATSEALVIGQQFGLDASTMVDVMNASTGRNSATTDKAKAYMLSGKFNSGGALKMLAKDVRFARAIGYRQSKQESLLEHVVDLIERAQAQLGDQADHTELYRFALQQLQVTQTKPL